MMASSNRRRLPRVFAFIYFPILAGVALGGVLICTWCVRNITAIADRIAAQHVMLFYVSLEMVFLGLCVVAFAVGRRLMKGSELELTCFSCAKSVSGDSGAQRLIR